MSTLKYISTRGQTPERSFCDILLTGLADDGGLYMPESWPRINLHQIREMAGQSYAEIAKTVLKSYIEGEIKTDVFNAMVDDAYATFSHAAIAPLKQIAHNHCVVELFHGPTLAFKDVAMQLLAKLMNHALSEKRERATVIGATSGDTGGAAAEAFRGCENVDVFILFPHGRVSPVQQRQMTTLDEPNIYAIAIEGSFDDCQSLAKALFNNHSFRDQYKIAGVNSISWARIMAQIVYYFSAASALGAPDQAISFTTPTGNFGNVFAGFAARKMGLPIRDLIIATNQNDILARAFESGQYRVTEVIPTMSPSMDIQVSSNFERLLFEAEDRNGEVIRSVMSQLEQTGSFHISDRALEFIRKMFRVGRSNEEKTMIAIRQTFVDRDYLLDPHTAVGVAVANGFLEEGRMMATLATAHPAKFPQAISEVCGIAPALPQGMEDLMKRKETFSVLEKTLDGVENFIRLHSRIT